MASLNLENSDALDVLKISILRIQSIALIHEKLYHYNNLSRIQLKNYDPELLNTIIKTTNLDTDIGLQIDIDDVMINLNQTIPLALFINEVVSNAIKHAFNGLGNGTIKIVLSYHHDILKLMISDNGNGITDEQDMSSVKSLGMQLIHTLAKQLNADLSIENANGTKVTLHFECINKKGIVSSLNT